MPGKTGTRIALSVTAICLAGWGGWPAAQSQIASAPEGNADDPLERRFSTEVRPFLERYCFSCHGSKKPNGGLDLSRDATVAAVAKNTRHWERVLDRLDAKEMPPEDARRQPEPDERAAAVAWVRELL